MCTIESPHVLSVQSHVVSGYVGNKSATFPLQLLGFEVDVINTVQLSNHTGYKTVKGQVFDHKDLDDLMDGLEQNGLDTYTHLLTGYVGSPSFLKRMAALIRSLKEKNRNLIYVCDPVMGDNGKMYVPESLIEIYKQEIIPLADVVTPNQFELELLTNKVVTNIEELKIAVEHLHKIGPKIVAVSSTDIDNKLMTVVSSVKDNALFKIDIPKIPAVYTGSGDLFAALFLAHLHLQDGIKPAIEKTINSLHDVLKRTYEHAQALANTNVQAAKKIELQLIQSKRSIESPPDSLVAVSLR